MKVAIGERARVFLEGKLPAGVEPVWYDGSKGAVAAAGEVEAGWLDIINPATMAEALEVGRGLKWVFTVQAGVSAQPLATFKERGIVLTNGAGLNSIPVAEYAIMGMFALAKNLPAVLKIQEGRVWPRDAPGVGELFESKALIVGYGAIGKHIGTRLEGLGVEVVGVRRRPSSDPAILGPDQWRARLGEFDWVILAAPATQETDKLIGAAELAAMKPSAFIINIARGAVIDQPVLLQAINDKVIAGAFLDVVEPEPAPPEDPVWSTPGVIMTSHLSGRAQTRLAERGAIFFLENLKRYVAGEPLQNVVDLDLGY
ncbi:D-2-hydroxyacid dehydrogenase [Phenylobacterium sp.]|uniref:D-2-hydroxyacid dehydrogenase n=1 Tax=Phenylobacterium sp. TaxID=1871053 RepID=UPI002735E240|nr:D-2-hydroxyacid dehydrogenase [Phenylobacterium sp.]MDP3659345.1 D-2-hydroxyacid dehydrogenase [Phenylobacterium sp.]